MNVKVPLFAVLSLAAAGQVRGDSINQVAQEIKQGSVISLRQNVASFWAENLLDAQAASPGLDSLDLSIAAVLKAIGLERDLAGFSYCNLTNCIIVNAQSTVAIDPNAGSSLSPSAIYFGDVPVTATPEPEIIWLLALGTIALLASWNFSRPKQRNTDFNYVHPERKA